VLAFGSLPIGSAVEAPLKPIYESNFSQLRRISILAFSFIFSHDDEIDTFIVYQKI